MDVRRRSHRATRLLALALAGSLLAGCNGIDTSVTPAPTSSGTSEPSGPDTSTSGDRPSEPNLPPVPDKPSDLSAAQSNPVEDSYYPHRGEPYLDTLHYDLALDWKPSTKTLSGKAKITFRVTEQRTDVQFDLGSPLTVNATTLDGKPVTSSRGDSVLKIATGTLDKGSRHELVVDYSGTPAPVPAPSERSDQDEGLGFTVSPDGTAWTMQEPFGAFTWYPVNDQPADKAFYDATLTAHEGTKGVFNGRPGPEKVTGETSVRRFHLDQPASSYLTTVAFGEYALLTDKGPRDLPLFYWYRPDRSDRTRVVDGLKKSPEILTWLEKYLGPYPFATGGSLMVPSDSAMETQTMNTMGDSTANQREYFLPTLAHEYAHQWVGDVISPVDWRDMWLNEGLALFLQAKYEDHAGFAPYEMTMSGYRSMEPGLRRQSGPPGKYDKDDFAASNVYVCGAVMYDRMATAYGDKFWAALKTWPSVKKYGNVTRDDLIKHFSDKIGVDLKTWITTWLESETTPTQEPPAA